MAAIAALFVCDVEMEYFSDISQLTEAYPWSDGVKSKLVSLSINPEVAFLAVRMVDGEPKASAYPDLVDELDDQTVALFSRSKRILQRLNMIKSKTMQAVELVEKHGFTQYMAAKKLGIHQSAVSRAIYRREEKKICPCCEQVVREGFKVNKKVLKTD